ncbi:MAG: type IV pilus twitching motility protein PilT [Actinomycetota bacterium]|nr:type IV pilus twitching motility protein PilT [Actinomycetota bacterium]
MFRINGDLVRSEGYTDLKPDQIKDLLLAVLDDNQKDHLFKEKELDFSHSLSGIGRFRVNYFFQRGSLAGAFRVISSDILSIEDLHLPQQIKEFATYPRGLVLVTGPTGSGKSTTLASIINLINESRVENIITIEDPIEYLHRHKKSIISQREVGFDTKSFARALKYVLREDPDIILVGEMRDLETISSALTAAETGHLVFSTLHTQDAAQTLDRIVDIFPPHQQQQVRIQLAGTLKAVLVQQLLPTVDNQGRVPAVELMFSTTAIRNLVREMKTHQIYSSIQAGGRRGMITMDMSLANLYRQGKISRDIALEKCHNREDMERMLG